MNIFLDFQSEANTTSDLRVTDFHLDFMSETPNRKISLVPRDLEFTVEYPPTTAAGKEFFTHSMLQEGEDATLRFRFYSEQGTASFLVIEVRQVWIVDLDVQVNSSDEFFSVIVKMVACDVTINDDLNWVNDYRRINFMEE